MISDNAHLKSPQDQGMFEAIPCDPYHLQSIVKILDQKEPSLRSLLPFFENDAILLLRLLSVANKQMVKKSAKPISVRSASHALTLIGLTEIKSIVFYFQTLNTKKQNLSFQVYRSRLEQAKMTCQLSQKLCQLNRNINFDDVKIFSAIYFQPYLYALHDKTRDANIQYLLEQILGHTLQIEQHIFQYCLIEKSYDLMQFYCLPQEYIDALKVVQSFMLIACTENIKFFKCNDLVKCQTKDRRYNSALITFASFILIQNANHFNATQLRRILCKFIARLIQVDWQKIWAEVQEFFILTARNVPSYSQLGKAVMNEEGSEVLSLKSLNGLFEHYSHDDRMADAFTLIQAEHVLKMPVVNKIIHFDLPNAIELSSKTSSDTVKITPLEAEVPPDRVTVDKVKPSENINQFIQKLKINPKAYGTQLPAFASLLETLRMGLSAEFALVLLIDDIRKVLWVGSVSGLASKHPIRTVNLTISETGLLKHFLTKPSSLRVNRENREKVNAALPECFHELLVDRDYFISTATNARRLVTGIVLLATPNQQSWGEDCYLLFKKAVRACQL